MTVDLSQAKIGDRFVNGFGLECVLAGVIAKAPNGKEDVYPYRCWCKSKTGGNWLLRSFTVEGYYDRHDPEDSLTLVGPWIEPEEFTLSIQRLKDDQDKHLSKFEGIGGKTTFSYREEIGKAIFSYHPTTGKIELIKLEATNESS